jgi:hypothetical protein
MKRFNELGSELLNMRGMIANLNRYLKVTEREELKLSDDLLNGVWDALQGWASVGGFSYLWSNIPPFERKTTLAQWIADLIRIRHEESGQSQELLGWSQASLMPPTDLQEVEIWRHHHPTYLQGSRFIGYFYWGDMFLMLNYWRKATDAHLEMVEWAADSATVRFTMKWRGEFRSIKVLDIEKAEGAFWVVALRPEAPAYLSAVSTTYLFNAQLIARLGGNRLVPAELQPDRLTMVLNIPRADTAPSYPPSLPVAESVLERLASYLISRALPKYVRVSECLEPILSKEIRRLEPYRTEDAADEFWFDQLQVVLDQLQAARETLMSYM